MARQRWLLSAVGVLATAIAISALAVYLGFQGNEADREVHLLPYGYSGPVIIILERPDGTELRDASGARLYEIPGNGVLLTKFPANAGNVFESTRQFFYVRPDGSRERLPFVRQWTENFRKSMTATQLQAPSIYGLSFGTVARADGTGRNEYYTYVVGPLADSQRLIGLRERQAVWSY
jgi:hypothetical protein